MNELKEYLEKEYPKESKAYYLLHVAFLNDYHRRCRDELLYALHTLDDELSKKAFGAKLIGSAMYDIYDWIRHVDKGLYSLLPTKETRTAFRAYFNADVLDKSQEKLTDIIHGEGYSELLREAIRKALSKDDDHQAVAPV